MFDLDAQMFDLGFPFAQICVLDAHICALGFTFDLPNGVQICHLEHMEFQINWI